jgi:hypothetical protein
MQDHQFSFEVNGSVEDVWAVFWGRKTGDVVEHGNVRIEILHGGDENGEAKSWEWLTQVKKFESWRYDAVGKPLWSKASGWTRLEALDDGRTRVHFRETYHVFNPLMRFLLEKPVHRAISKDNDQKMKMGVEMGLKARARAAAKNAGTSI